MTRGQPKGSQAAPERTICYKFRDRADLYCCLHSQPRRTSILTALGRRTAMRHVRHTGHVLILVILILGCTTAAFAQGRADIVGRVTDASGGVLPGVTVTAQNMATNIVNTTVTTETGDSLFTTL